jgi:hypothetical protein
MLHSEIPIANIICNYNGPLFRIGMKKMLMSIAIASGLALVCVSPALAKEKEEEESLNASDVPAAVQKAAETEAKGARIVRWEKEGTNYEAVIEKGGKKWGYKFDANGKMLGKHSEASEKGEKEEH